VLYTNKYNIAIKAANGP